MNRSRKTVAGMVGMVLTLSVIVFVLYPDIGEKILYGKHPPDKKKIFLEYSEIIVSGKYDCMESSSKLAKGNFEKFVREFNDCNS